MSHAATFYEILGVTPTALTSEIKQAHRKLAQQNHPDKLNHLAQDFPWVVQEATERFKQITEAFNVLSNDAARSKYDAQLNRTRTGFHPRPAAEKQRHAQEHLHRNADPADSPFHATEPRAPRNRKNVFLSGLAFVALVTFGFAAFNDGPLAKELHSLQFVEADSTSQPPAHTSAASASTKINPTDAGYQFADIRYLRTLFNGYLVSRDLPSAPVTHQKEFSLLQRWDPSYYQSKFIVISWENPSSNQTQIGILFLDQPDTVFQATVTRQPGAGRQLQSFIPLKHTPEEMADIRAYWSQSLADPTHAL
jgi:curved DNA-binding protein CbpA